LHQERKMRLIFKTAVMVYFKSPPSTEEKTEGRIKATRRRGKRRKQILDDFKERRGFWKWKGETLDRNLWWTRFGRGYGFVARESVDDLKGKNGFWKLKGEALDRNLWRIGRGYGFVVRQTAVWMNWEFVSSMTKIFSQTSVDHDEVRTCSLQNMLGCIIAQATCAQLRLHYCRHWLLAKGVLDLVSSGCCQKPVTAVLLGSLKVFE
jgi:hypothetical protein